MTRHSDIQKAISLVELILKAEFSRFKPFHPIGKYYGLHVALDHYDAHIPRFFVDCVTYI